MSDAKTTFECANCGETFEDYIGRNRTYCSRSCWKTVVQKLPEPEKVERLYWGEGLSLGEIAERYDTWHTAVGQYMERHGIPRRGAGGKCTDDQLLDDLITGYAILGWWPKSHEYNQWGEYTYPTLRRRFGSWSNAIGAAKNRLEEFGGIGEWCAVMGWDLDDPLTRPATDPASGRDA